MKETRFKDTEIGQIPEEWEMKILGEICDFRNGYTPSKSINRYWENGSIPWFRMEDIRTNGRILSDSIQHITEMAVKDSLFPAGSIIISTTATIGEYALLIVDSQANQQFTNLTIRKSLTRAIDIMWFFHYCNVLGRWCRSNINEGGLAAVNMIDLQNILIPIPSTPEQVRIASALTSVDNLISSLDKLIEKKKNIKQGTMQQLLTGKKRLKGFSDPWVERKMGRMGSTFSGLTGKTKEDFGIGNAKYITFLNVLSNPILKRELFEEVLVREGEKQNSCHKGDLFFNTTSETPEEVGICAMLDTEMESLYLNSFCFGYRLNDDRVVPEYFAYYFRSNEGRKLMTLLAQGVTRYNMSKSAFNNAKLLMPSTVLEQKAIVNVLKGFEKEIEALEVKKAKFEQIKQGMRQQLLTGKIRLI